MQRWSKRQLHERPIPYSCSELWRWSGSQDVIAVMRIRRLPLDCVRSEWAPEMVDEQGVQLEQAEQLWYLHVPSNKFSVKRDYCGILTTVIVNKEGAKHAGDKLE